jgi:hypothetical protein
LHFIFWVSQLLEFGKNGHFYQPKNRDEDGPKHIFGCKKTGNIKKQGLTTITCEFRIHFFLLECCANISSASHASSRQNHKVKRTLLAQELFKSMVAGDMVFLENV